MPYRILLIALACASLLALAACGASKTTDANGNLAGILPWPLDRATSATDTSQNGTDAEQQSPGATPQGTSLLLSAGNRAEFAIYRFAIAGDVPTSIDIALDTVGTNSAYVGLANYATQRWVFAGPYSGPTTLPLDIQKHVSPLGNLYVAILAAPGGSAKIDQQTLHRNRAPVGSFTMTPDNGNPPLLVAFDASASSDPDGNIASYEWDFNADSMIDDSGSTVGYQFDNPGTYPVTLYLTDGEGAKGELTQYVVVHGWSTVPVPNTASINDYAAAVIGGNPAVVFNTGGQDFFFLRANDPQGADWPLPLLIDHYSNGTGVDPCLADVNGNPAVVYRENNLQDGNHLQYLRALNATGSSWPAVPQTLEADFFTARAADLAVVAGVPVVAYQNYTHCDLRFVRAQDAAGDQWNPPQIIDDGIDGGGGQIFGYEPSILVVGGQPAIASAVFLSGSYDLYYTRASDAAGVTWPASSVVAHYSGSGVSFINLSLVSGQPAIGYWHSEIGSAATVVRAQDALGAAWGAPLEFEPNVDGCSFGVVGGKPACAYTDFIDYDLHYAAATDADGAAWGAPQTFDPAAKVQLVKMVVLANGNPLLFYCDNTSTPALKMARLN